MDPQTIDAIKQHLAQAAGQDWARILGIVSSVVTPLIGVIIGLVLYIWRHKVSDIEAKIVGIGGSHSKCLDNCDERRGKCYTKRESELTVLCGNINKVEKDFQAADAKTIDVFREIIKEERVFTHDVMVKQAENIRELFQKVNGACVAVTRTEGKIESIEKICGINHRK